MTPQELKNSILQRAIQGRLVEQRPEEGTAEELFRKIQAEKRRLVKAGKMKKEKHLPEIAEGEIPFDIPESWMWVRISELGEVVGGGTPKTGHIEYWDENGIAWLTPADMKHVKSKYVRRGERNISITGLENSSARLMPKGTVLYSSRAPIGYIAIAENDISTNQGFKSLVPSIMEINEYIYHCLIARTSDIISRASGTTFKEISGTDFGLTVVPLPPLAEQRRIVAKIEELMSHVDQYAEAWNRLEAFKLRFPSDMRKTILQRAMQGRLLEQRPEEGTGAELYREIQKEKQRRIKAGELKREKPLPEISEEEIPFDIPDSWVWVSIGSVCVNIQYGTSKKSEAIGNVAVLRMGNLQNGHIDYTKLVYSSDESDIAKYSLVKDDLLFNRTNSKELVGKTSIYKAEVPAIYAGYLIRLTPVHMCSDYLNYVMQSYHFWDYCQQVKSDAIGQSNINAEKLKAFSFPLPPLAEQRRIVAKLEKLLPMCGGLA